MPPKTPPNRETEIFPDTHENFFYIHKELDKILYDCFVDFDPAQTSLLTLTLLLGVSAEKSIHMPGGFTFISGENLRAQDRLALFYSRFFELAPWIQTPPGPRPLPLDEMNRTFLQKYGLFLNLNRSEDLEFYGELVDYLTELGANRNGLENLFTISPDAGFQFVGIRLLSSDPLEFKLVRYTAPAASGVQLDSTRFNFLADKSIRPTGELFIRGEQNSLYVPDLGVFTDSPSVAGPRGGQRRGIKSLASQPTEHGQKKVVFKQTALESLPGTLVFLHLNSA